VTFRWFLTFRVDDLLRIWERESRPLNSQSTFAIDSQLSVSNRYWCILFIVELQARIYKSFQETTVDAANKYDLSYGLLSCTGS
jgi:hypothetical protein